VAWLSDNTSRCCALSWVALALHRASAIALLAAELRFLPLRITLSRTLSSLHFTSAQHGAWHPSASLAVAPH